MDEIKPYYREIYVMGPKTPEAERVFEGLDKTKFIKIKGERYVLFARMKIKDVASGEDWMHMVISQLNEWDGLST